MPAFLLLGKLKELLYCLRTYSHPNPSTERALFGIVAQHLGQDWNTALKRPEDAKD